MSPKPHAAATAKAQLPRPSKRRAVSAVCQLIFNLEDAALEAVCATSRRNNLSIAPEHRTSCVPSHQRPIPELSSRLGEPKGKASSKGYIAGATTRVFGGTTADMPFALVLGCCATLAAAPPLRAAAFFVWRAACVPITSFAPSVTNAGIEC